MKTETNFVKRGACMYEELKNGALFDLSHSLAGAALKQCEYPWEILDQIGSLIMTLGQTLPEDEYKKQGENVWIHKTAVLYPNVYLAGPAIIGPRTQVRPGAFVRGNALVGADCVVGNSTELKNVILFDHVQVPHYNYVGDSVLGYHSHMGAGAITSNVKQDNTHVTIRFQGSIIDTGRRKFGAILGDFAEIGCNSVLNPGSVIGQGSRVYPLSMVRGVVPAGHIYKTAGEIVEQHA